MTKSLSPLPRIEVRFYYLAWLVCTIYTMYNVYVDGHSISGLMIQLGDLKPGWSILGRMKDVSDLEWVGWINHLYQCLPWLFSQLVLGELARWVSIKAIPLVHIGLTSCYVITNYSTYILGYFIIQVILFFGVLQFKSRVIIWLTGLTLLIFYNKYMVFDEAFVELGSSLSLIVTISIAWFILKCISFTLREIDSKKNSNVETFLDFTSYVFYFPCFHCGPFIPYEEFRETAYLPFVPWTSRRIVEFLKSLVKYSVYIIIFEVSSHYFYCHAMHYHTDVIASKMGYWTLNGIGYCMAKFFYLKYVIIYGVMGSFARAERYKAPPHPRCIHRIHRYSDMWRYFDRGFYLFIFRCIYIPLSGSTTATVWRKLFGTFSCFCFVFIWHGGSDVVLCWSILNFLGIIIEKIGEVISNDHQIQLWQIETLSEANIRRLHAFLSAPPWMLAVLSSFIFFCGNEIGLMCFQQLFKGPWLVPTVLIAISYCMCQISMEIGCWDGEKKERKQ